MRAQEEMFLITQRQAEMDVLSSRCVINRNSESSTLNETTGIYESSGDQTYSGPCLVRPAERDFRKASFGGNQVSVHMYEVRLPKDTEAEVLDIITVTASNDSGLVGRHLVVRDVLFDEWSTVRKVIAEEVR